MLADGSGERESSKFEYKIKKKTETDVEMVFQGRKVHSTVIPAGEKCDTVSVIEYRQDYYHYVNGRSERESVWYELKAEPGKTTIDLDADTMTLGAIVT
jgi:hypothetical protein